MTELECYENILKAIMALYNLNEGRCVFCSACRWQPHDFDCMSNIIKREIIPGLGK